MASSKLSKPKTTEEEKKLQDGLKAFANVIVDRIIEEEQIYQESLRTDPNAKRIYDTCTCSKCMEKRKRKSTPV